MREILFRGKRVDNGKWVVGYYCKIGWTGAERDYIIPVYASYFYGIEVAPETVGQCTDLIDRKGKQIFEGDIIRFEYGNKVHFDVVEFKPPMFSPSNCCRWSMWKDEVIGNIHDNSELLKEETET